MAWLVVEPKILKLLQNNLLVKLGNKFYAHHDCTILLQSCDVMEIVLYIEQPGDGPYIAVTKNSRIPIGLALDFDVYQKVSKNIAFPRRLTSLI